MANSDIEYEILPAPKSAPAALAFQILRPDGKTYSAYAHARPAVTATVVLRDRVRNAYLLTRRSRPPFENQLVFPGGFLEAGTETSEAAAVRELYEETGAQISPDQLRLIDARSHPSRDPRDHVIDIGYYAEADRVCARPLDGVSEVQWIGADELNHLPLGFDHGVFWHHVCAYLRKQPFAAK